MPKAREVKIKELSELPLLLTINDIVDNMGFSRPEVDSWFKEKSFPAINAGILKVFKYDLIDWLYSNKGNRGYKKNAQGYEANSVINSQVLDTLNDIKMLLESKSNP